MPWKQHKCRNYSNRTTKTVWLLHRWRRGPKNNLYKEAKNNKIYQSTDKVIRSKMKLFALAAATAVDANPWPIRVMTPAPGIVNEQGGYWADQPTHPQAPQINKQVHQPYVQKPQCCEGYTWISPSGDSLWMRKSGEHHSKPYYTATDKSGAPLVLLLKFYNDFAPFLQKLDTRLPE